MKITDVKINGMKNPTGYSFDSARVSWKVTDSQGIAQKSAEIEVSLDREFKELLYKKNSADLNQTGEALEMKTEPRTRYFVRVTVTDDQDETAVSEPVSFETAKMQESWLAKWITTEPEYKHHPFFFKEFEVEKEIQAARLYISGLGLFQAELNGRKVGDEVLTTVTITKKNST